MIVELQSAFASIALIAALLTQEPAAQHGSSWRLVDSREGATAQSLCVPLPLDDKAPEDVAVLAPLRGRKQQFAQLRFGTPDSIRIPILLDHLEDGGFDLYVDRDRTRTIRAGDRLAPSGDGWTTTLEAEGTDEDGRPILVQPVRFTWIPGAGLARETLGGVRGQVSMGAERAEVLRVDADGNGLFSDPADRIWIDLDGSGLWSPFTEQLPLRRVLLIGGNRYSLRYTRTGLEVECNELTEVGRFKVELHPLGENVTVEAFHASLVGRDGSLVPLTSLQSMAEAPAGEYRLSQVTLSLRDAHSGTRWNYLFSDSGSASGRRWHVLEADSVLTIPALEGCELTLEETAGELRARQGTILTLNPRVYTSAGLSLNACNRGDRLDRWSGKEPKALLTLRDGRCGTVIETVESGFS